MYMPKKVHAKKKKTKNGQFKYVHIKNPQKYPHKNAYSKYVQDKNAHEQAKNMHAETEYKPIFLSMLSTSSSNFSLFLRSLVNSPLALI